ncbi:MAG: hypothetical protein LBM98_01610 [Oscillospiraceae bacterium]|nr:hypothetical protein [Oscillospiraceae bacterium]
MDVGCGTPPRLRTLPPSNEGGFGRLGRWLRPAGGTTPPLRGTPPKRGMDTSARRGNHPAATRHPSQEGNGRVRVAGKPPRRLRAAPLHRGDRDGG